MRSGARLKMTLIGRPLARTHGLCLEPVERPSRPPRGSSASAPSRARGCFAQSRWISGLSPAQPRRPPVCSISGDSPLIHLDCARIRALGWRPTLSIRDAIRRTVDWLEQNPSILDERAAA